MSVLEKPDPQYEMFGRLAELPISPLKYYSLLRKFNDFLQEEFKAKLGEVTCHYNGFVTLITPGSDGRMEKGSLASPIEIIALLNEDIDPDDFRRKLTNVVTRIATTRISEVVEVKTPNVELNRYNFNGSDSFQPGRVAESRVLYGTKSAVRDAKKRLSDELISLPKNDVTKRIGGMVRDARKPQKKERIE